MKLHSITSIITNSSTTIFTYSENSEESARNLVNEIFETFNLPYKFDDVFKTVVLSEYPEEYYKSAPKKLTEEDVRKLYDSVLAGEIDKPTWFKKIEKGTADEAPSTYLHIIPKDEKYKKLAKQMQEFLYSTYQEATYS